MAKFRSLREIMMPLQEFYSFTRVEVLITEINELIEENRVLKEKIRILTEIKE